MSGTYDVLVVGGGHNGLVAAATLAKAGRKVALVEARASFGGMAGGATGGEAFAPGYTAPLAHILHQLHPEVIKSLDLGRHGLALARPRLATVALDAGGDHLTLPSALTADDSLAARSPRDAKRLGELRRRLMRFAGFLREFQAVTPPRLGTSSWEDRKTLMRIGWRLRRMGRPDLREFLRIALINIYDVMDEEFEDELLKGAIAFDAVLGTELGPRSPNSLFTLLYRLAGEVEGEPGALALPQGGMTAVVQALVSAAEAAGVELKSEAPVKRVLVEGDRAAGVELASGETLRARTVLSNADPKTTFLRLVEPGALDTGFLRRVRNLRAKGLTAKLHLALDAPPSFTGLDEEQLGERLLIAPTMGDIERAFDPCKYGELPEAPPMEIVIPSLADPSLAPEGKHLLSAAVQGVPYRLKGGWEAEREAFAERLVSQIAGYAPGLEERITARELLTPADIEARYGATGGHWHHAELAPDQLLMMRPVPGAGQYATPLPGLYLCGAGAHPGGGVMGAAGLNAARQVMKNEGS